MTTDVDFVLSRPRGPTSASRLATVARDPRRLVTILDAAGAPPVTEAAAP